MLFICIVHCTLQRMSPANTNVYFTIFAGRKRYLSILKQYLDVLLAKQQVTEVHLWAFTKDEADLQYMRELANAPNSKYIIFYPANPHKQWEHYYDYYYRTAQENDIVIKCDDDVLFLDLAGFDTFLAELDTEHVHFPSIMNNDICAYFQQKHSIHNAVSDDWMCRMEMSQRHHGNGHVPTNWYMHKECAVAVHSRFLDSMQGQRAVDGELCPFARKGVVCEYGNRISINCLAAKGAGIRRFFGHLRTENVDDEFMVGRLPALEKTMHQIHMGFVVEHFQFAPQADGGALDREWLDKFAQLAPFYLA